MRGTVSRVHSTPPNRRTQSTTNLALDCPTFDSSFCLEQSNATTTCGNRLLYVICFLVLAPRFAYRNRIPSQATRFIRSRITIDHDIPQKPKETSETTVRQTQSRALVHRFTPRTSVSNCHVVAENTAPTRLSDVVLSSAPNFRATQLTLQP